MSAPSSSLHPTRRQLDELDALMERMLELPVNPAAEEVRRPASDEPTLPQPEDAAPLGELASHGFVSYRTEENDASVMTHQSPFHFTVAKSAVVNPDSTNRIVITGTAQLAHVKCDDIQALAYPVLMLRWVVFQVTLMTPSISSATANVTSRLSSA